MKHCTKCGRQYHETSLRFCTEDGTPLTPQFDSEAETVKVPDLGPADVVMEIADYLRRLRVRPLQQALVRFEDLKALGLTSIQISENFPTAVRQAGLELINQTETRATIRNAWTGIA